MKGEEEGLEPMSPSAQYLKSSALSLTICGVLESENEIDDSMTMSLLKDIFLPINPRFSSIMVCYYYPSYPHIFFNVKSYNLFIFFTILLHTYVGMHG